MPSADCAVLQLLPGGLSWEAEDLRTCCTWGCSWSMAVSQGLCQEGTQDPHALSGNHHESPRANANLREAERLFQVPCEGAFMGFSGLTVCTRIPQSLPLA